MNCTTLLGLVAFFAATASPGNAAEVAARPYRAYAWAGQGADNIVPFYWIRYAWGSSDDGLDVAKAKAAADKLPEGQSSSLYASLGQIARQKLDGAGLYGDTPFAALRHSLNHMRSMALSSEVPVMPWISHKGWDGSRIRSCDLYQELIFHTALAGADDFLLWNPYAPKKDSDPSLYGNATCRS
jgi:hypothetical protein